MKKIFSILAGTALLAACNSNPNTDAVVKPTNAPGVTILADTSGLSEFQAWKANAALRAEQNQALDEGKTALVSYDEPKATVRKTSTARRTSTPRRTASRTYSSGSATTAPSTASYPVEQTQQKKGWSKAAKGAVIGGAGGAILGGVLVKNNRALGAVIGGVVGGGVGYGIGRSQDKKDGRY